MRYCTLTEIHNLSMMDNDLKMLQLAQDLLDKIKQQPDAQKIINVEQSHQLEREIKRLRQTTFGAITAGLIIAGFTIFTMFIIAYSFGEPVGYEAVA
ncbi:hypothetical protein LC653_33200 [Nostoc sp. CHAB 5784]|uniref:hypothetical protein n=1 Tax=Nostoc mirabile TaxID=2907820 RepID=UPI001E3ABFFB|nr:hypothetical protein [Nostoc mirabile]MCC5668579.1 hypothetical protein [Nostoc mirabile CHAB5784]